MLSETIGSRVAGTEAQARAANFLAEQLGAAGLAVRRQEFTFRSYEDRGSQLTLTGSSEQIEARALRLSADGSAEGELVAVGLAREGDFDPAQVSGKVALAQRGEILFSAKVANLEAAGAKAVVVYNNQPGRIAGSLTSPSRVPVVTISGEDGERLAERVRSGPESARVSVTAAMADHAGQNIIASSGNGPRRVVIGAHFDSVAAGPGANDNGSGTVTVLELARVAAARRYPFAIDFVLFDAEEVGLIGSARYVEQLDAAARQSIIAMINLDMVGVGDRLTLSGDASLVDLAARLASERSETSSARRAQSSASDHASFAAAGIPTLFINRPDDPNYHTAGDRQELVEARHLASAGQLVLDTLDAFAVTSPSQ
jgi:aminopeptidase YwaD